MRYWLPAWIAIGNWYFSAAWYTGQKCRRPSSVSPCDSTSTETKRLSLARRSISSTARSGACIGTTIEARSRLSFESHSAAIQSLIALQNPAAI